MTFEPAGHPRGQADNAGQFRDKSNSGPEAALGTTTGQSRALEDIVDDAVGRLVDGLTGPDSLQRIRGAVEDAVRESQTTAATVGTRRIASPMRVGIRPPANTGEEFSGLLAEAAKVRIRSASAPSWPERDAFEFRPAGEPDEFRRVWEHITPHDDDLVELWINYGGSEQKLSIKGSQTRRILETLSHGERS